MRIAGMIAALVFVATGFAAPLFAELSDDATTGLLCSGDWVFQGKNWSVTFTFNRDHTVVQHDNAPKEPLTWSIVDNQIVIKHAKYDDFISLPLDPKGTAGHSNKGKGYGFTVSRLETKPQSPPQTAGGGGGQGTAAFGTTNQNPAGEQAQTPSISPEMQQKAAELVKAYHTSFVFVTGKEGAGSGFIATLGKSNFLISNAHVAAGIKNAAFKTLDDAAVPGGAASIAVGRDIFCMAQPAGGTPLEIMQDVGSNAAIGDDVVVLGNAEGEGVVNTITGKIVGIGADRVEIDAPFVPGNSGSPIIHLKSGKVIGVATYLVINDYDAVTNEKNVKPVIRRFGYRLDNVKAWQAVDWRPFYAQAAELQNIDTLTADLFDLFNDMQEHKGSITPGRHTNPVIKSRIDQWMEDRTTRRSAEDENMANANFFSFLKVSCQADVTAAKQHITYDNFKSELAEEQEARDAMTKAFEGIINNLRD
jgi:hypothetical protein